MIAAASARRRSCLGLRIRLRLRGLITLVALAALALTAWRWWCFSAWAGCLAYQHRYQALLHRDLGHPGWGHSPHTLALIAYHERLSRQYEAARWRPWLAIEPDPPPPTPPPQEPAPPDTAGYFELVGDGTLPAPVGDPP